MAKSQNPYLLRAVDWSQICPWFLLTKCVRFGFSYRLLLVTTVHLIVCALLLSWAFRWAQPEHFLSSTLRECSFVKAGESTWVLKTSLRKVADSGEFAHDYLKRDLDDKDEVKPASTPSAAPSGAAAPGAAPSGEAASGEAVPKGDRAANGASAPGAASVPVENPGLMLDTDALVEKAEQDEAEHVKAAPVKPWWAKTLVVIYVAFSTMLLYMMLARIAAVKVATDVRLRTHTAAIFALGRIRAGLAAAFFIGLTLCVVLLPIWLIGKIPQSEEINWILAPIGLLLSTIATLVLLGGTLGFPFVLSELMAGNSDCFEGLSRAYAYVFQKPQRLLFYAFATLFFGVLGFIAISILTILILFIFEYLTHSGYAGASPVVLGWCHAFGIVPWAFLMVYSFTAMTGIYMLRRQDIDAIELNEVWLEDPQDVPLPILPQLK